MVTVSAYVAVFIRRIVLGQSHPLDPVDLEAADLLLFWCCCCYIYKLHVHLVSMQAFKEYQIAGVTP